MAHRPIWRGGRGHVGKAGGQADGRSVVTLNVCEDAVTPSVARGPKRLWLLRCAQDDSHRLAVLAVLAVLPPYRRTAVPPYRLTFHT